MLILFCKAHVKAHTRRLKNGKVISIAAYSDKRVKQSQQDALSGELFESLANRHHAVRQTVRAAPHLHPVRNAIVLFQADFFKKKPLDGEQNLQQHTRRTPTPETANMTNPTEANLRRDAILHPMADASEVELARQGHAWHGGALRAIDHNTINTIRTSAQRELAGVADKEARVAAGEDPNNVLGSDWAIDRRGTLQEMAQRALGAQRAKAENRLAGYERQHQRWIAANPVTALPYDRESDESINAYQNTQTRLGPEGLYTLRISVSRYRFDRVERLEKPRYTVNRQPLNPRTGKPWQPSREILETEDLNEALALIASRTQSAEPIAATKRLSLTTRQREALISTPADNETHDGTGNIKRYLHAPVNPTENGVMMYRNESLYVEMTDGTVWKTAKLSIGWDRMQRLSSTNSVNAWVNQQPPAPERSREEWEAELTATLTATA